jgi:4-amino-4-deoxy-L-arabinose transferase-like glycosyltransferase
MILAKQKQLNKDNLSNKNIMIKQFSSVRIICWIIFIASLAAVLIVRWRLLNIPLERDEGEYAYLGQLLLQGISPYKLAYNMKLPGTYAMYALFMASFGQSIRGIHLGFLFVNLASIALVFFISKRLFNFIAGIFSAITFAFLSLSRSILGVQAHATHFVVFMALCGLTLLLKAAETEKKKLIFFSGLFFGLAFLMKQQGAFFLPFGIFYLSWAHFQKRPAQQSSLASKLITYVFGSILPFAFTCLILFFAGVFDKFWFWVFQYASKYSSHLPLHAAWEIFINQLIYVINPFRSIWYVAVLGLVCLFIDAKARKHVILIVALLITSFLTICPGLIFREHYFVTLLPIISILVGCCINSTYEFIKNRKHAAIFSLAPVIIFAAFLSYSIYQQKDYFFVANPAQISRQTYGANPFIESVEIANYLKANSTPDDTIAVLGSEPQIYFYSQRHSATGYIYTYALMENQPYALKMQGEMIKEIESARPKYLVLVNVYASWLWQAGAEKMIWEWFKIYSQKYYKIVGIVDIISKDTTNYYWDAQAQNVKPHSASFVLVFKRQN